MRQGDRSVFLKIIRDLLELLSRFEWGLRFHISNKLPSVAKADELRPSLCVANRRIWGKKRWRLDEAAAVKLKSRWIWVQKTDSVVGLHNHIRCGRGKNASQISGVASGMGQVVVSLNMLFTIQNKTVYYFQLLIYIRNFL